MNGQTRFLKVKNVTFFWDGRSTADLWNQLRHLPRARNVKPRIREPDNTISSAGVAETGEEQDRGQGREGARLLWWGMGRRGRCRCWCGSPGAARPWMRQWRTGAVAACRRGGRAGGGAPPRRAPPRRSRWSPSPRRWRSSGGNLWRAVDGQSTSVESVAKSGGRQISS